MPKRFTVDRVLITSVGAEGAGVGRVGEKVIFVKGAVPGDIVEAEVFKQKPSFLVARLKTLIHPSPDRVSPFCEHFGVCGGCRWQNLSYDKQLFYKQQQVVDALKRIGKLNLPEVSPILASKNTTHYRNKLEFSFSERRWFTDKELPFSDALPKRAAGFHVPDSYDRVFQVNKCYLQPELSNQIRNGLYDFALSKNFEFYHIRQKWGFLRCLTVRSNQAGEWMLVVQFFENRPEDISLIMNYLKESFPQVVSLFYTINPKGNDTLNDLELILFSGKPYLEEIMDGLRFRIGPKSFFQVNLPQALELYRLAAKLAGLDGRQTVYDLYTGTGTIALFLAAKAKRVIGIELVAQAIEDAQTNAALNQIQNVEFFAMDIKDALNKDFVNQCGMPDVVVVDPPRSGMEQKVCLELNRLCPQRIVYISCNPATQARDVAYLSHNYDITFVQPVDMFPHTAHVENVLLLERKA